MNEIRVQQNSETRDNKRELIIESLYGSLKMAENGGTNHLPVTALLETCMKLLNYSSLSLVALCLLPVLAVSEPVQDIKIGVLLPLTGQVAAHGKRLIAPIESTKQPGIEFVFEDDACQSAKAITGYENLRRQGIKYFLGPCCSASMKTVAPHFASDDELSFATCPISEEIYSISNGHVLTTFYSIEADAGFIASRLYDSFKRKVFLIFQDTEFGRLQERSFKAKFKGEVVDTITYNQPDVSELRSVLLKLRRTDFDAIYIPQLEPFLLGVLREIDHC